LKNEIYIGNDLEIRTIKTLIEEEAIFEFNVLQNNPNPFSEKTTIEFVVPYDSDYKLVVSNAIGKKVFEQDIKAKKGINHFELDHSKFAESGIYIYSIKNEEFNNTQSMIYLK
jgi:hypothetical protein